MVDAEEHWEQLHSGSDPRTVSWFEPVPAGSLEMLEETAAPRDAAILDAGGGSTTIAGWLLEAGYTDVTVADISAAALEAAREDLGPEAERVEWVKADLRSHRFDRRFDIWHDRAVLHFMVDRADREAYVETIRSALKPSGQLLLATFGPEGPETCSGLPVARYRPEEVAELLAEDFVLTSSRIHSHVTPTGREQQFLYARLIRQAPPGG